MSKALAVLLELKECSDSWCEYYVPIGIHARIDEAIAELLAQPEPVAINENTSDGYHTFKELYEFRKAYNVALFNEWGATGKCHTHKSWRHNDGELCFGGGWFIVVAVLPQGQISNHYEAKDWDLFSIQEVEKALFEFDGHTGADVVERLKLYLAPPKREPFGPEERERLSRAYSTKAEQVAFEEGIIFAEISYSIGCEE